MTDHDEYLRNAAECERMAAATKDEQTKSAWLALAEWCKRMTQGNNSHKSSSD